MEREQPIETETPVADSDRHLMARTRLSNMGAFEQLFRRYYQPVRRLLYRTVEDDDLADDLVQETFLALYTHPPQLQGDDEELRAWLFRVALNRGYNALRSRRRSQAHLPEMYVADADAEVDPEAEALRTEERKRVRDVLKLLPERQAKLLLLRQEGGLKYAEIAAILEVAPGSVGTLLVRAERAFELAWNQLGAQHTNREKNGGPDQ